MRRVPRWEILELEAESTGPVEAWFVHGDRSVFAGAFADPTDPSMRRIRFTPDQEGIWRYTIRTTDREVTGRFRCTAPESGVHGPVRVAYRTRFEYADGTRYLPFGLSCEPPDVENLEGTPISKARFPVDPAQPMVAEQAVHTLRRLGIEADLVIRLGADADWQRNLTELVARLGAYRNVWWSLPAAHPSAKPAADLIREYDCGGHLLSLHGEPELDAGAPWLTHLSVATENVRIISRLVDWYRKPVIVDDCGAVGGGPELRDAVPAPEMVTRIWEGLCRGGFVTWRGTFDDELAGRIRLLRDLLADAPPDPCYHPGDYDAATLRAGDSFVLQHHGNHRFPVRTFELPDGEHRVEIIDTWSREVRTLPGRGHGQVSVRLPTEVHQAVRAIRRTPWTLTDSTGTRTVSIDLAATTGTLSLWCRGEPDPYLTVELSELVSCSLGKPWRDDRPGLIEPRIRRSGEALLLEARLGELTLSLRFEFESERLAIELAVSAPSAAFDQEFRDVAVGLRFPLPDVDPTGVTMPGLVYRGNRGSEESVAVPRPERGVVMERHRFPIPAVSAEWGITERPKADQGGKARQLTVFGMADGMSLGVLPGQPTTIAAMSGVLMFDGVADTAYVHKGKLEPITEGYHLVTTDRAVRIRCELDWGTVARLAHGHRAVLAGALGAFPSRRAARPFTLDRIIELKTNALDARWTEDGGAAGYLKFPLGSPHFLYGWTGQCLRLAWCDARLGSRLGQPERVERCRRAVDFYVDRSGTQLPGLRYPLYWSREGRWAGFDRPSGELISSRAYGETLCDLIDVIELWKAAGWSVPARWNTAVQEAVGFLVRRIVPDRPAPLGWRLDGTAVEPGLAAGLPCVEAIARAGDIEAATVLFEAYQGVAWARSTLDAACEDKESGIGYLRAALALADATGEERYHSLAQQAAEWLLSWVYVWNPRYPQGSRFERESFCAVGWSSVSVQNHHLDVFFPYWEMARLGYRDAAFAMLGAVGQGICRTPGDWGFETEGEQAEGFFQTNWQRRGEVNNWNPSWVIAQVLSNALRLKEDKP